MESDATRLGQQLVMSKLFHLQQDWQGQRDNKLLTSLRGQSRIHGSHTAPYHTQGKGQVERFNWSLLSMLPILAEEEKMDWKNSLV